MTNPFATKFTRPGSIPYLFKDPEDVDAILRRLERHDHIGQIVGPHGSGKTTLARHLSGLLGSVFDRSRFLTIRSPVKPFHRLEMIEHADGEDLPIDAATNQMFVEQVSLRPSERMVYFVDGWGQVESYHRRIFIENCENLGIGLIVTVHRKRSRLPVIAEIQADFEIFTRIVRHLQRDSIIELNGGLVRDAFVQAAGNFREAFMSLYDDYEVRYREKIKESV